MPPRFSVDTLSDPRQLYSLLMSMSTNLEAAEQRIRMLEGELGTAVVRAAPRSPGVGGGGQVPTGPGSGSGSGSGTNPVPTTPGQASGLTIAAIKSALQTTGQAPLDVTQLRGILAQSQRGFAVIAASASTLPDPSLYEVGTIGAVLTSSTLTFYLVADGMPHTWVAQTSLAITAVDNAFTIQDDVDGTKKIRFEVSLVTTGTTRVMTAPDVDQILAGRNVDNSFSVSQTILAALNGNLIAKAQNTDAAGTSAVAGMQAVADVANLRMHAFGSGNTATAFGLTVGAYSSLNSSAGSGILIGTTNAGILLLATNNVERVRIDSAGLSTFKTAGKNILIKPASAPPAGTLMIELQTDAGVSKWSVDIEGDMICRNINSAGIVSDAATTTTTATGEIIENGPSGGGPGATIWSVQAGGSTVVEVGNDGRMHIDGDFDTDGNLNCDGNGTIDGTLTLGTVTHGSVTGTPEGVVTAVVGSTRNRTDGGAGTSFYVKESGSGNTGWVGK